MHAAYSSYRHFQIDSCSLISYNLLAISLHLLNRFGCNSISITYDKKKSH